MLCRHGALFALGLMHGFHLFFGDIPLTYSLMGLILLATHSMRTSTSEITGSALIGVIGALIFVVSLVLAAERVHGHAPLPWDMDRRGASFQRLCGLAGYLLLMTRFFTGR